MGSTELLWLRHGASATIGAAVVLAVAWVAIQASGVLLLVFLSVLLASGLEPLIDALRARLPTGRLGTILLVYGAFLAVVLLLGILVIPEAVSQAQRIARSLPDVLDRTHDWAVAVRPAPLSEVATALVDEATVALANTAPTDPNVVVSASLTVAEALVATATVLSIVIFWLIERVRLQRYALAFLPGDRRAGARDAWNEIEDRLGMWVRGQLILMSTVGVATGITYTLLGLPAALALAIVAALCEAIPIIGPLLGAIPALLVAITVSPQLALAVAIVYVVIQLVEGNVLVPLVMRNTIGLSPFLVVVSLLIGGAVAGLVGALIAVPVAASLEVVLERVQARDVPVGPDPAAGARTSAPSEDLGQEPGTDPAQRSTRGPVARPG